MYSPDVTVVVPLGVKQLLLDSISDINAEHVHEMDWWDSKLFSDGIEMVCTPAQHNSGKFLAVSRSIALQHGFLGRGLHDQCKTLWASWVVRRSSVSVYHAGWVRSYFELHCYSSDSCFRDTGYATASGPCPAFAEIGEKYGPFDLAMIPIWRGASLSVLGQLGLRVRHSHSFCTRLRC